MLKLYEHVDQYQVVLDWIEEHAAEIEAAGGVLPQQLEELLEEVEGSLQQKVERIALVVQNLRANAEAAASEAKRLQAIAQTYERQAATLKAYLHAQLQRAGIERIDAPRAKVRIQINGRPTIRPANPENIPEPYRKVIITFDGEAAYRDLKARGLIPGGAGRAEVDGLLVERGTHLRIW
jgi:hypothetical protein